MRLAFKLPDLPAFAAAGAAFLCVWAAHLTLIPGVLPLSPGLAAIGMAIFFVRSLATGRLAKPTKIELAFALFTLWCAISITWAASRAAALIATYQYLLCLMTFVFISRVCRTWRNWRRVGWAYVIGCMVASSVFLLTAQAVDTNRYSIDGINSNYIAYAIATGGVVLLTLTRTGSRIAVPARIFIAAWYALAFAAVFYSGSRGALLGMLAGGAVFALFRRPRALPKSLAGLAALSLLAYLVFLVAPQDVQQRLTLTGGELDSSGRFDVWPVALNTFLNAPVGGIGVGGFIFGEEQEMSLKAHNLALSLGAEVGLVGLALYLCVVALIVRHVLKRGLPEMRACTYVLLATWLPIALTGVWDASIVAWLVFAWFAGPAALQQGVVVRSGWRSARAHPAAPRGRRPPRAGAPWLPAPSAAARTAPG